MANETGHGDKVVDGTGNAGKATPVNSGSTERYECLRCDTTQVEPRGARNRARTVRCRQCGNGVYPVTVSPEKKQASAKFCKTCQAKLRRGNGSMLCSMCDR
jgi:hypothetical protein